MFFEQEMQDLKEKLAAIAKSPPHWRDTRIGRYTSFSEDVERFKQSQEWWRHDTRGSRDLVAVNELLERVGVGRLRDESFEAERDRNKSEADNPGRAGKGMSGSEVAEHQRDKAKRRREAAAVDEKEAWEEYLPGQNDNIRQWYEELPKHVDINPPERKGFFSALGSYIGKFPASAIYRDLDQATIEKFVKLICEEAYVHE